MKPATRPGEPAAPDQPSAPCERCGRPFPLAALEWWRGELLCDACRIEEDNCGCGDDDSEVAPREEETLAKHQRIALVTGANKGLGLETCRQLGRLGITVLLTARDRARGEAATALLREEGLDVRFVALDVTNSGQIHNVRLYLENHYGRLDILVNNAGTADAAEPLFGNSSATVSPDVLRRTFDVNFFGLVELTQALLPLLKKSPAGRIVNVASILGSLTLHSDPNSDLADTKPFAYDASKTAVNQFTIHLAAALAATPIKVNSAHPGWVRTDLGGAEAPMEVGEGAKTAVRLATLGPDGPTGGFFHGQEPLPW